MEPTNCCFIIFHKMAFLYILSIIYHTNLLLLFQIVLLAQKD